MGYFKGSPNDNYKPTIIKVNRITTCEFLNDIYIKYLMKSLREPVSDYPQFDGPGPEVCGSLVNVIRIEFNFGALILICLIFL